ncbi:hypothetical protein HDU98_003600 [Podochytrium sp. JEL0797]|nr:hypothetical protein HDU98_003600 [Podochytrium sp. JEL0797]
MSIFLATALFTDSTCSAVRLATLTAAETCTTSQQQLCSASSPQLTSTFCVNISSTADAMTAAAPLFQGGITYAAALDYRTCTSAAPTGASFFPLNNCVQYQNTNTFVRYDINTSSSAIFAALWSDPQCLDFLQTVPVTPPTSPSICQADTPSIGTFTTASVLNNNGAAIKVRYTSADCNTPVSLSYKNSTTPCVPSDNCAYGASTQAYLGTTCVPSFNFAGLDAYIGGAENLFGTHDFAEIWEYDDPQCTSAKDALVTFLNSCVPQKSISNGITVQSKIISLSSAGTLIRTRFNDTACLVQYDTLDYGTPDFKCRNMFRVKVVAQSVFPSKKGMVLVIVYGVCSAVGTVLVALAVYCCMRRNSAKLKEDFKTALVAQEIELTGTVRSRGVGSDASISMFSSETKEFAVADRPVITYAALKQCSPVNVDEL